MTLQWVALGVVVFFGLLRLPAAIRGENRVIFTVLLLMSLVMALSIPFFYLPLDSLLGGVNVANLVIRYSLFAIFLILGLKLAAAFDAQRARRAIGGPAGRCVLAGSAVLVAVLFWLSDLPESSTGLAAYWDQDAVHAYGDVAGLYPVYVGGCLIPALVAYTADSRRRNDIRISAGLMSLGFSAVVIHSVLGLTVLGLNVGAWDRVLPYGAVILVTLGLALLWNSQRIAKRHPQPGLLARAYGSR
ncbi:hypothetical protein J2M53_05930 [Arthrobacter sp. zg-ZUI100]|uniref:hypothetical protein n=1 Tax=Arthrobacter jiangjiafuii TaxID=2817475 RepID=UPI001AEDFAFB|nr:hypothetical protein [Arthrobacter jiangjiafuii]MBP3035796.1 hypothetical protein [Arthrobacter jiangjiafuii]